MTEKELSKYYFLKKEVEDLEERIKELGNGLGAIKYTDTIKGIGGKKTSLQEKIVELKNLWMEKRVSALEEYIRIEKYISNIEDSEIRSIMRYRFMDLKTWDEIGNILFGDRTTAPKKMRKYIKNNSHISQ